jgi:PilZ domain
MVPETTQPEPLAGNNDRRRIPRYSCSGQARISCLPLNGALLSGRLRDLGLGGCCIESIETSSPFDLGAQTEILMEVNSWYFRALGHVRALRDRSGISIEFMRMSAGGYSMLADLIADLERPRTRRHSRRPPQPVEWNRVGACPDQSRSYPLVPSAAPLVQNHRIALVGTIMPPDSAENTSTTANRHPWLRDFHPAAASVDIFA